MLKRLLGIADLEDRQDNLEEFILSVNDDLEDLESRHDAIRSELEDLSQEKVDQDDLEEKIQDVVEELEFVQGDEDEDQDDFSPREKQILRVLLHEDGFLGTGEIADELEKSKGTIRKYMSMLKDKVELSTRKDGRKTLYRLPGRVEDEILEGSQSITLTE
jgi:DNA-binding NarL/FixJ family response regulator